MADDEHMSNDRPLPGAEMMRQSYANLARAWALKGKVVQLPQVPEQVTRKRVA